MATTSLKSFAHSSGKSAGKKKGSFSGQLLGKMAEGLEALEAIAELAAGQLNRFMSLAQEAVKTYAKKLEAQATIPFANPDVNFNPTLNPMRAAMQAPSPSLGGGGSKRSKPQQPAKKSKQKKSDKS